MDICSNKEVESFGELLHMGLDVIAKFRNELKAGRLSYASVSGEVGDKVSKVLSNIGRVYNNHNRHTKIVLADHIATAPTILEKLYDFLRELFKAVSSSGLEEQGTQWITFFLSSFVEWSDASQKFRCKVLQAGFLCDHLKEVNTLTSDSDSKFVTSTVSFNLNVIFNCSQEELFSLYYERASWTNFFLPWLSCKHLSIKWHSKFILGNLLPILEEEELSLLDLEEEEMEFLVSGFEVATTSSIYKVQISSMVFSALELLCILTSLIASPRNYSIVATPTLIQPLIRMVSCDLLPEQVAACTLIWKLLERLPLQRPVGGELLPLIAALQPLECCGQPQLESLSKCILMEMEGISSNSDFVKGCYANGKYEECVFFCNQIKGFSGNSQEGLLGAKATYMLFQKEVLRLRKGRALMSPKVFHRRHDECYAKAKEVITMLSRNELTKTDEEASKMLDLAIQDVINETNQLCDVQVCYLCHTNLLDISNFEELQSIVLPRQDIHLAPEHEIVPSPHMLQTPGASTAQQSKKTKRKLARSHYIPNSILRRFSNAHPLPSDQQTYVSLYLKETKSDRLHSARQLTYFMLCSACEGIVSRNGEEQFPSLFFNKIYDQDDPLKSKSMQKIEYGKWLYTFCLGIIFRNLHWHRGYYVNEDDIYQLLVQCRTCLLNVDSIQSIDNKPEIFLLVNPLFASDEDAGHGYMNVVLNNTCAASLRDLSLDCGAPQQMCAHFFIVHMGVINILVKFSPAQNVEMCSECLVHPGGGVYTVPPDEARRRLFPTGVWKLFQSIAQDIEVRVREYPVKLDEKLVEKQSSRQPSDNVKDVFGIVKGFEMDKQNISAHEGVTPSPSTYQSKKLNLLPSMFQVRPSFHSSAVLLPDGHSILLHYTDYLPDSQRQSVLFLCIGSDSIYSNDRPYIIWHYEGPGLVCSSGFFFSTADFSATEFLPDDNPKAMLKGKQPTSLAPFVKRLPELLPQMLELKGFYSLDSLLLRVKALRSIPNIDRKCSIKKCCWYCNHLCNTCLTNPSVFGLTKSGPSEQQFNFCSSKCQEFHPEATTGSKSVLVVDSKGEQHQLTGHAVTAAPAPRCAPISSSHKEVVHIFIVDEDYEGYPRNTEISLCKDDGIKKRLYVVLYQQTLCYQRFLEFFVANFSPVEPLPYLANVAERIWAELNKFPLQNYIQEAARGLEDYIEDNI